MAGDDALRGPLSVARKGLLAVSLAGVAIAMITVGFLLVGNEEWMAAAPSSLLFRLRYWRSTLGLLADHPWMGAGPGGFQSMYLRYRLPVPARRLPTRTTSFLKRLPRADWWPVCCSRHWPGLVAGQNATMNTRSLRHPMWGVRLRVRSHAQRHWVRRRCSAAPLFACWSLDIRIRRAAIARS